MSILLPTSTAGSLPKPSWFAEPEQLWSPWKLEGEQLLDAKRDALSLSLHEQLQAGINIVSDGEQTRQHFVATFIEHLEGVDFEKRETVRIRNRYDASVPSVECQNSHVPMDLIELIRGKKVMVGAIDVATNQIETPEQVADTLRKALKFVDADKLYPSINCGMAPLSRQVAQGKLNALSAGAAIVRQELAA